jgi:hypothetical protein
MRRVLAVSLALNVLLAVAFLSERWGEPLVHAEGGAGGGASVGNGDVNADGAINITDAVHLLEWLFRGGPAPEPIECPPPGGGALPATGQTECTGYVDGEGWVTVPCETAEIAGQDGAYQAGCPMAERFVDHGDGTVTDTCTGLLWQKDTADVNGDGVVSPEWDGGDAVVWREALEYCEGLSFAGHDDWRLPNVRELQSIVDYGRWDPAIDPVFGALSSWYWSSSTSALYPDYAWGVDFGGGGVGGSGYAIGVKGGRKRVRAVRRGP